MRDLGCEIDFPVRQKVEGGFYESSPYCHRQNMDNYRGVDLKQAANDSGQMGEAW